MPKPGEIPPEIWRSGKMFLLTPNHEVYEKTEQGDCWLWESYKGVFRRDPTLPATRWRDLVKERSPLVSLTAYEAMLVLAVRFTQEVYQNAAQDLDDHRSEKEPHYLPDPNH